MKFTSSQLVKKEFSERKKPFSTRSIRENKLLSFESIFCLEIFDQVHNVTARNGFD